MPSAGIGIREDVESKGKDYSSNNWNIWNCETRKMASTGSKHQRSLSKRAHYYK